MFGKQGARFPKQKVSLDPPIQADFGMRSKVKGGRFSKATRFSWKIEKEANDGEILEKQLTAKKAERDMRVKENNDHLDLIAWKAPQRTVHSPLRMLGASTGSPQRDPVFRRTMFSHMVGPVSSVHSGGYNHAMKPSSFDQPGKHSFQFSYVGRFDTTRR